MIERWLAGRESVKKLIDSDMWPSTEIAEYTLSFCGAKIHQDLLFVLIRGIFGEQS